jgi:O-antigen/teichoic acid export membrane protein
MSLARRSVGSVAWNGAANLIKVFVLMVRSVLLARLLPVQVFGVYAGASAIVGLTVVLAGFGMGAAFLHRAPETEDVEQTAAVHFTLLLIFTTVWALLLGAAALLFSAGPTRTTLLLLIAVTSVTQLTQTPRLILTRRVTHQRLAIIQLINAVVSTLVAVVLALNGLALWALLAMDIVTMIVRLVGFYAWRPVWRPRLAWSKEVVRYFLGFGSRNVVAISLFQTLERAGSLWTRVFLGVGAMGFYSRAYTFATYPHTLLGLPINAVAGGTYAELKGDRRRLSEAFFRTNAFLVRTGFFLSALAALIAPEFIRLLLGEKWLPMLDAYRLMLVFALLAILLHRAKAYVDFSAARLFWVPSLGVFAGLLSAQLASTLPGIAGSDWRTAFVKIAVFSVCYLGVLMILERRQTLQAVVYLATKVLGLSGHRIRAVVVKDGD